VSTEAELLAQVAGVTGLDEKAAAGVIALARTDPPQAAQLLYSYQAAAADGTPSFIEDAWKILQEAIGIAMPLAGALETAAGVPGAVKSLT
jgi:hypothetical protein